MTDWMFLKRLDRSQMVCDMIYQMVETTDSGLKSLILVEQIEKCNCIYDVPDI